ncbi:SLC13 family permease [Sporomusa sp.]|uniref:SLC13 family permease n=1 Tax=Sporomusa sp. TaxID=2078658 RepID=UPI002B9F4714|nr:SLC13 family permease [Sporomusa sp.]HWR06571.1 SLC13 family permease [Sporomusa sp.]
MELSLLIVLALLVAIILGFLTEINIGLFAISFAYFIGAFVMKLKPGDIVMMWPLKIFFILFSITLFYNFAIVNGTLEKFAMHLIYKFKQYPMYFPFIIFFVALVIAAMGAGFFAVAAFMYPLTLVLCEKINMSRLLGVLSVALGAITGSNFMLSMGGVIITQLIAKAGYGEQAYTYAFDVFLSTAVFSLVLIVGVYVLTKGYKLKDAVLEMDKPDDLTREQKINLYLILGVVVVVLAAPIASIFAPTNPTIKLIKTNMDIGFVCIVAAALALLLKLGNEKQVMGRVPWGTIIMICGVGILIETAVKAGTIKLLAGWVGSNIPSVLVPVVLGVVGGIMAAFSSVLGVVLPTMYPLVSGLSETTGLPVSILFVAIQLGAISMGMSPFSGGGSLALAACHNEESRQDLFPKLFFIVPAMASVTILLIFIFQILA